MTVRPRTQVGVLPYEGMHTGGIPFLIWDYLDSWPDEWRSEAEIHTHVTERRQGTTHAALNRALWRLVHQGVIEYRMPGHTLVQYRIAQ